MDHLRHSEKVEYWVQKIAVLVDDSCFVPSAFSHSQMVLSSRKLCLLSFFSFQWRLSPHSVPTSLVVSDLRRTERPVQFGLYRAFGP